MRMIWRSPDPHLSPIAQGKPWDQWPAHKEKSQFWSRDHQLLDCLNISGSLANKRSFERYWWVLLGPAGPQVDYASSQKPGERLRTWGGCWTNCFFRLLLIVGLITKTDYENMILYYTSWDGLQWESSTKSPSRRLCRQSGSSRRYLGSSRCHKPENDNDFDDGEKCE